MMQNLRMCACICLYLNITVSKSVNELNIARKVFENRWFKTRICSSNKIIHTIQKPFMALSKVKTMEQL